MAITVTGSGTELDPYVCYSWEDFESLGYIVNIDHMSSNTYTLTLPETGLVPIPQEQINIFIKFADQEDLISTLNNENVTNVIDFKNDCIPHTLLFKNVCQIDFNGWTFKNICVSYWQDVLNKVGEDWQIESSKCIGNTIIIQNSKYDTSLNEYPRNYVKILNGKFSINEDWKYLKSQDIKEEYTRIINNTFSHLIRSDSFIHNEIDNYQTNDLGGDLYGRCFPLFFLNTYTYFFRAYFDGCDFSIYQSGFTDIYDAQTSCTKDDGYSIVQHSPNYIYNQGIYTLYPEAAAVEPGNALFVYCNISIYNNHGVPKWSTDSNMSFLNSKIKLFGNANISDIEMLTQQGTYKWEYDNIVNLIRYWHGCLFNYCDFDIIINLPQSIWIKRFEMFTSIYNSSLNVNCYNTDNCTFTGYSNNDNTYYSGVFIHAYPMKFTSQDSEIQNARKIIDITGVRVSNYYELQNNPDYVLGTSNIPDDNFRLPSIQTGQDIDNYYTYMQLKQNFRFNRYIRNGLPFVPTSNFPIVVGYDVNRTTNALYSNKSPDKVMFNNMDISSMWTGNNITGLHWQKEYEPILQSQLYGNWFNNTIRWDNERKTIETSCLYTDNATYMETIVPYMLESYTYTEPLSNTIHTYYINKKVETFNIVTYQDNDWLPIESYKHHPENLTGVELSSNTQDLTKCMWFSINKSVLNQFNWCIVISSMVTSLDSDTNNYLFYLPITDSDGIIHVYYIKQYSYYDATEEKTILSYCTNITKDSAEHDNIPVNIPQNVDLYEGCHIFAINCYGILLELFVDGQLFGSVNITDFMKVENPIRQNASIGHCNYVYNTITQNYEYNTDNNFNGTILGVHMFADYCSWADIWNIYSTYGIKFFKKGKDPIFIPILKEISVANVPPTIDIMEGSIISYSDLIIYGHYTSGTQEIHRLLTYSIAEGTLATDVGQHTVTITCKDLPEWHYEFLLNVQSSYVIKITQLDINLLDTDNIYKCETMLEAKTYLNNADINNRYKLEISNEYPNTYLDDNSSLSNCITLSSIYLPDKITYISRNCFSGCTNLKEVYFGESETVTLADNCFSNCGFELLSIPSNINLTGNCFQGNLKLKTVIFNNNNLGGFRDCTALSTIILINNVNTIKTQAFRNCTELVNVDLTMVNNTIESNAFLDCSKLEFVKLSENLKYVGERAFANTKLLSDFNNSENNYLIVNNYLLATNTIEENFINIPNNVTGIASYSLNIGDTLPNCTELVLPMSLKYLSSRALCPNSNSKLQTLNIPSVQEVESSDWLRTTSNQTVILENLELGKDVIAISSDYLYNAFTYNIYSNNITINPDNNTYKIYNNAIISYSGEVLYRYFNTSQTDNIIPETIKYISANALELLEGTNYLYIPKSVISIGDSNYPTITRVTVDGSYSDKPIYANIFNKNNGECTYTENISIRAINYTTMKPVGSTAVYADKFTTAILNPLASGNIYYSLYTGNKTDLGTTTLYNSTKLLSATITNNITTLTQYLFQSCTNLRYVELPETLISIGNSIFYNCTSLQDIHIPDSVQTIHRNAFTNSGILKPGGTVTNDPVIISGWLLSWKNATGDITIDASVRGIADYVFSSANSGLTSVNINNVIYPNWEVSKSPSDRNFYGCNNITNYYVNTNNLAFSTNENNDLVYTKDFKTLVKSVPKISGDIIIHPECTVIRYGEFVGNSNITSININNVEEPNWGGNGDSNFYSCTGVHTYEVSNTNTMYASYNGIVYTKNYNTVLLCPRMLTGELTFHDDCRTIAPNTLPGNANITSINLNKITNPNWGADYTTGNFKNCTGLLSYTAHPDNTAFSTHNDIVYSNDFKILLKYPRAKQSDIIVHPMCNTIGEGAFYGATALKSTNVIDVNNVTYFITNAFRNIKASIIINKPIKKLESYCLYGCTGLKNTIYLDPDLTEIETQALYSTYISDIIWSTNLQIIGDSAFSYCTRLTSLSIPNSVTTLKDKVFAYCTKLENVIFPNSITSVGHDVFINTPYLSNLRQLNTLVIINNNIIDAATSTGDVHIPEGITYLPNKCFYNCTNISSVSLPSTLTDIRDEAFSGCKNITEINIPDSVAHIGLKVFYGCSNLQTIISLGNPISIEERTFYNCTSLTSVVIPNSVSTIGSHAFYGCNALETITISSTILTTVEQYAFYNCTSLTTINLPDSVTVLGDNVFYNCSNMTSINIPNKLVSLGNSAFSGCSKILSINVPGTVKRLNRNTFNGCTALTTITLNEGLEIIAEYAFSSSGTSKCGVTTITIPKSVTTFETSDSQGIVYTLNRNYFVNLQTIYIKNPPGTYDTSLWRNVSAGIVYI